VYLRVNRRLRRRLTISLSAMDPPPFKIILCGDSSCGKTSLLLRFTEDSFADDESSTLGVGFGVRKLGKQKLQIWDTTGQERYRNVVTSYLRDARVVVFVYDVRNKDTFNNIEAYWTEIIQKHTPHSIRFLVGNKSDAHPKEWQVSSEMAMAYAMQNKMYHVEVSAKTGVGVENVFEQIAEVGSLKVAPAQREPLSETTNESFNLITSAPPTSTRKTRSDSGCGKCCHQ